MSTDPFEAAVLAIQVDRPGQNSLPEIGEAFGSEFAQALADACLLDRLEDWADDRFWAEGRRRVLLFQPADAGEWFDARVAPSFALQAAESSDPSRAILAFFQGEFEEGAGRVVLLIGESPNLDPNFVVGAFLALNDRDVVLGPRTDGGIYLIGAKALLPGSLEGLEWEGPSLLTQLVARLAHEGLKLSVLPPWYGLKTESDCRALAGHLLALRAAGAKHASPRVSRLLLHEASDEE